MQLEQLIAEINKAAFAVKEWPEQDIRSRVKSHVLSHMEKEVLVEAILDYVFSPRKKNAAKKV